MRYLTIYFVKQKNKKYGDYYYLNEEYEKINNLYANAANIMKIRDTSIIEINQGK